jgi:hypothetical protein
VASPQQYQPVAATQSYQDTGSYQDPGAYQANQSSYQGLGAYSDPSSISTQPAAFDPGQSTAPASAGGDLGGPVGGSGGGFGGVGLAAPSGDMSSVRDALGGPVDHSSDAAWGGGHTDVSTAGHAGLAGTDVSHPGTVDHAGLAAPSDAGQPGQSGSGGMMMGGGGMGGGQGGGMGGGQGGGDAERGASQWRVQGQLFDEPNPTNANGGGAIGEDQQNAQ